MRVLRKLVPLVLAVSLLFSGGAAVSLSSLTPAQRHAFHRWIVHLYVARWFDGLSHHVDSIYPDSTWWRIAVCETGGNVRMHGSTYSSAFGVLNQAVRERADDAASAQRILAGVASYDEQLRMAKREANRYGITAWASGTLRCASIA